MFFRKQKIEKGTLEEFIKTGDKKQQHVFRIITPLFIYTKQEEVNIVHHPAEHGSYSNQW